MIHATVFQPHVIPFLGSVAATQIDRLQDMTTSLTLNRTKIEELGRDGIVDWRASIPSLSLTLRQLEYGDIELWKQLANTTTADDRVDWSDFDTPQVDIAAYETDDTDTFKSTIWYPNLRLASFGLTIGDPDAMVERTFNLIGEDEIILQGNNKYLITLVDTQATGANHTIFIGEVLAGEVTKKGTPLSSNDLETTYGGLGYT